MRRLRSLRADAALLVLAWGALLAVVHPAATAGGLGLPPDPGTGRVFESGALVAFLALGCLAWRFLGRLLAAGRAARTCESRGELGTVMAEFALVLPVVGWLICSIIQLALICNAALVVRYAAFAGARSAIVSFEADMPDGFVQHPGSILSFPPFPEWVDRRRPELAVQLVLASISPRAGSGAPAARDLEAILQAQAGVWDEAEFASRMGYAVQATKVTTIRDRAANDLEAYHESLSPLVQRSEHVVPPALYAQGFRGYFVPIPGASNFIPGSITIQPNLPTSPPTPGPNLGTIDISRFTDPLIDAIDSVLQPISGGAGTLVDQFADSGLNVDPFSPKRVAIGVSYDFLLTLPSFQLLPGMTKDAPVGRGKVVSIQHERFFTVELQSTGGRRAGLPAFVPYYPDPFHPSKWVSNTPLYWR